jgi:hypothetical protein
MRLAKAALGIAIALAACDVDTIPDGARRTPVGTGPRVVFDVLRRPLPEIPAPNDVATFPDPTSRTGVRINASTVSPTRLESISREGFDTLEGWGTFAPLTVAFERSANADEIQPAIDIEDVAARTSDWDPSDDPFYVIDLTTGVPALLDMGKGNFPLANVDPKKYWRNDPRAISDTLLFETVEEGAGGSQAAYRPDLDTDFDGVLDHPNVLRANGANGRIEEVIPWYERESDTLIMRPLVPLEEKRQYAVVLTDRLHGQDRQTVRSPFDYIHHPAQRDGAERVRAILGDASKKDWFGDIAGTGLDHVAFVWTFTTQPVYEDMRLLRDGLHGVGPFARLATDFPPIAHAGRSVGLARDPADTSVGSVDTDPRCAPVKNTPYIVRVADAQDTFRQFLELVVGLKGPELDQLVASLDAVDHFVIGSFESPYFLGDPEHEDPDGKFELDFRNGQGRVGKDTVQFWLSVPKKGKQPFPVTMWAHGTTLHADEIIIRSGYFAQQGIAMMGINMPGHGLYLTTGQDLLAETFLRTHCFVPWVTSLEAGRDRDLNGDGIPDSGGLLWTAHIFHSRDNIRQAVVDEMQATRVIRSWDGIARSDQDYDGNGAPDLAGDFDGNGVPDVGGPNVTITTSGNSFGGLLAMVHGAVDSNVSAAAPISGGGGLTDLAVRSSLVPDSVIEQILTPLVVGAPVSDLPPTSDGAQTQCQGDQIAVRFVVNDLTNSQEIDIACLTPAELHKGVTVLVENLRNGERRCARTDDAGRFRVPVPANVGDKLDVQILNAPDAVVSYKGCELAPNAPIGRRISTWEQPAVLPKQVGDETKTCDAAFAASDLPENKGCAQYRDVFYPVGSPLVAPQEGLGLRRQTPDLRRLFTLTQAAIDSGDPINFAPYYALRPAIGPDGAPMPPRALLEISTAGDPFVPVAGNYAFARAAGALPFLPPSFATKYPPWAAYATPQAIWDAMGGKSPNQVAIDAWVLEGIARLGRTRGGPACGVNYVSSATCTSPPSNDCKNAIADIDWLAEGADRYDAQHPATPVRLARAADVVVSDQASLERAWTPRILGTPSAPDDAFRAGPPLLAPLNVYVVPGGQHVFVNADPCKAFDSELYDINLLVRFLATRGTDVYYVTHPQTHRCLAIGACPFFTP